eukprot:TRINITY_DN21067_c0_g1_i2.p1 TRINITY_DN21067_c0_g1~~TRINITY_DN21067_c0_g1_i2.p1  ORF type:complete len:269 (+),score=98.47 TRINITY_DN21067_c0_g1_i2:33-809(+)
MDAPLTVEELIPQLYMPRDLTQAGDIAEKLGFFAAGNYYQCLACMLCVFVMLQSFNIPGTIFLNVVMGCVFGYKEGMALGLVSGTVGAMVAFTISKKWGGSVIQRLVTATGMGERMSWFQEQVAANDRFDLFMFLVFLRVSPVLPNWFINVVSPHVGVPPLPLTIATTVGIAPQTFLAVHAGAMLRQVIASGATSPIGTKEWIGLLVLGLTALLPVLLKHLVKKGKEDTKDTKTCVSRGPSVSPAREASEEAETKKDQ